MTNKKPVALCGPRKKISPRRSEEREGNAKKILERLTSRFSSRTSHLRGALLCELSNKEISTRVLVVYFLLAMALSVLVNLVLFPGTLFDPLERATGGLINATLQANLLGLALFALFVFGLGRLRPADVGLEWRKLPQALLVTGLLWLGMQVAALAISLVRGGVALDAVWVERGAGAVLGWLIGQLLGNALVEELLYRGLLLPQLFHKFKIGNRRLRLVAAAAAMLALFVLSHIPNRIFMGYTVGEMLIDIPILLGYGLLFTIIYLVTENLFVAVGVHALVNEPTLVTALPFPAQLILLVMVVVMLVVWRRFNNEAVSSHS